MSKIISFSELRTHSTCRRKWYLTYDRHLKLKREAPTSPAHAGTLIHEWLRSWYFPDQYQTPFPAAWEVAESDEWIDERDDIVKVIKQCENVTQNYIDWLEQTKADQYFAAQQSELHWKIEDGRELFGDMFPANWGLQGYIDLLGYNTRTGQRIILETKTTRYQEGYWIGSKLPALKRQLMFYTLALQHLNPSESFDTTFNVMRRVNISARSNPPYFWRYPTRYGQKELDTAKRIFTERARGIWQTSQAIKMGRHWNPTDWAWANVDDHCGFCEFKIVCPSFDDGSDAEGLLSEFYTSRQHGGWVEPQVIISTSTNEKGKQ